MGKSRLEAFSDGVLAIILTIMVLEMKVPHGDPSLNALHKLRGVFLSFVYIGIYWNNHHHLRHPIPTALYGVTLLMAGLAYNILSRTIIAAQGPDSLLRKAVGHDRKGLLSLLIYAIAIATACVAPQISGALYVIVAITWLIPDRRIERVLVLENNAPPL